MNQVTFKFDLRIVCLLLVMAIAIMTYLWKPWQPTTARTITVTGQASITQAPDQYLLSPTYTTTSSNRNSAVGQVTSTGNAVIAKLKTLGVVDSEVSNNISVNTGGIPEPVSMSGSAITPDGSGQYTATYSLTITLNNKDLAQKVSDYLATTSAEGTITPEATFSDSLSNKLQLEVRSKAITNARQKADIEAQQLGLKVSKVQSVSEASANNIVPLGVASPTDSGSSISSTPVLTGTQTVSIQLTIIFIVH